MTFLKDIVRRVELMKMALINIPYEYMLGSPPQTLATSKNAL
jgi:hypothetical protein